MVVIFYNVLRFTLVFHLIDPPGTSNDREHYAPIDSQNKAPRSRGYATQSTGSMLQFANVFTSPIRIHMNLIKRIALALVILATSGSVLASEITVYKSPTCGCCKKWVQHLKDNGFDVVAKDVREVVPYKIKGGVPPELGSCHTAFVDGYVIEGHVPASDIKRLLSERPKAKGLAVPAMPVGSPGMEQGQRKDPYDVILIPEQGQQAEIYSRH